MQSLKLSFSFNRLCQLFRFCCNRFYEFLAVCRRQDIHFKCVSVIVSFVVWLCCWRCYRGQHHGNYTSRLGASHSSSANCKKQKIDLYFARVLYVGFFFHCFCFLISNLIPLIFLRFYFENIYVCDKLKRFI